MERKTISAVIGWTDDTAHLLVEVFRSRVGESSVLISPDSRDVWRLVRRYQPKLLILHKGIPGIASDEFLAMLRQEPDYAGTNVIIVLPSHVEEERRKYMILGATGVFTLPIDLQDFFSVVAKILGLSYRKTIRFPVMISVNVRDEEKLLNCLCHNISRTGMFIYCQKSLERDSKYKVIFEPDDDEGSLEISFRVVRISESPAGWFYGAQFEDLGPNIIYRLERFISKQTRYQSTSEIPVIPIQPVSE